MWINYLWQDGIGKSFPCDHGLASQSLRSDDKRWLRRTDFLSHPHTHDRCPAGAERHINTLDATLSEKGAWANFVFRFGSKTFSAVMWQVVYVVSCHGPCLLCVQHHTPQVFSTPVKMLQQISKAFKINWLLCWFTYLMLAAELHPFRAHFFGKYCLENFRIVSGLRI